MIEFARPAFLLALPVVSLPILIHLLHRRRYRRVPWAAMRHLLRAEVSSRRRIRWRNLLLLALRMFGLLIIVLAFSRPTLRGALGKVGAGGEIYVILDNSASMSGRFNGATPLARAKEVLQQMGRKIVPAGGSLSVYVPGRSDPIYKTAPGSDLEAALDELRISALAFRPGRELAALARAAREQGSQEAAFYILTDLRAADWGRGPAAHALDDLQRLGPVRMVDVGDNAGANAGITRLGTTGRFVYAGQRATFRLTIANDSDGPLPPGRLELWLDGKRLAPVPRPAVPARASIEVPLRFLVAQAGPHHLRVALAEEDVYPPDDSLRAAFTALQDVPALLVEGRPGAADYAGAALRPTPSIPGLTPEARSWAAGPPQDISRYAAAFLCDVADPASWLDALSGYVRGGGRLVAFLGPDADPAAWNETPPDLIPARLGGAVTLPPEDAVHFGRIDFEAPLLRPFAGWEPLFRRVRFWGFRRLEVGHGARVLATVEHEGSSPLIVSRPAGRGRVFLFATSADDLWTDWPKSEGGRASYLALLSWLAEYGEPDWQRMNLRGGERLSLTLRPDVYRREAVLLLPPQRAGREPPRRELLASASREGADIRLETEPLATPGMGRLILERRDGQEEVRFFTVRPPASERNLERLDPDALRDAVDGRRFRLLRYEDLQEGERMAGASAEVWSKLIPLLLVLLLAESVLAYVFSNPAAERSSGRGAGQ
ncbi:MAG: BatA domain-containing protein [Planctomycetes bacterium]|nr:BatA domain-containing protein [Planctomycetota bacterium]